MTESTQHFKLDMTGILSETLRIANTKITLILGFILVVNTPIYLSRFMIPWYRLSIAYGESPIRGLIMIFGIIEWLFSLFTTIGVSFIAQQSFDGYTPTMKSVFSFALSRIDAVVWTSLVQIFQLFGRFLLLIIPGIIYFNDSSFALPASILRDKRGEEAIRYSQNLVHSQWWRVFWYQILCSTFILLINGTFWIVLRSTRVDYLNDIIYLILIQTIGQIGNIWIVAFFIRAENSKGIPRPSGRIQLTEVNTAD